MSAAPDDPRELSRIARACKIAEHTVLVPVRRSGTTARVYEARIDDRAVGYLKLSGSLRALRREVAGYRTVAPRLPARTPRLLGWTSAPRPALAVSAVVGATVERSEVDEAVVRAAGRALRALHDASAPDDDPVSLERALRLRVEATCSRLAATRPGLADALRGAWAESAPAPRARRLCHRDYAPRNWVWSPDVGLGVIDFAESGLDHPWADLASVLESGCLDERRGAAFFDAYGDDPRANAHDRAGFRAFLAARACATVAWAERSGDTTYLDDGLATLERLGFPVR